MFNNLKWDTRGGNIFQTPKEIISKPQQPLNINITRDITPVPLTSSEETKYRGQQLDAMIKARFGSK